MFKKLLFTFCFLIILSGFAQVSDFKNTNFKKADSIAMLYKNAALSNLPLLSYKLTYRLTTDVEKFRAIYFWVCNNIKSDYKLTNKILQKGKKLRNDRKAFLAWNASFRPKFLKKLITDKKTICTGYAFLVKELSALANIDVNIINGYAKTANFNPKKLFPNHSWNAVKLNEKWYLCDATFASGYHFVDLNRFIYDYNDGYFLTEPNLFFQNHFPEDSNWTLINNEQKTLQNFIDAPFVYGATFKYNITPVLPYSIVLEVSVDEKIPFEFYIDEDADIEKISITQNNGWKETATSLNNYTLKDSVLKFEHQISKKGLYDVHLKFDGIVVVTYTIKVLKNTVL